MRSADAPRGAVGGTAAENLRLLIDRLAEYAIVMLDADGKVETWNVGAQRLYGYRAHEIAGEHLSSFYTEEDVAGGKPDQHLAVAVSAGLVEDEGWRLGKGGSPFWANVVTTAIRGADDRLLGFGQITRDLTDRHRGEQAVRDSEERLRLLVENVSHYAIFMLDPDGRVASWNLGAERLKGYRADEIVGHHFSRFYPQEDVRAGKPERELEEAARDGFVEDEGWRVRKDGSRFWANVKITALRGRDGTLQGFGKVTRDMTERKMAEDALHGVLVRERETAARLRELDRMKTDFVAIVAHDLRSPLSVIGGFVDLLLSNGERLGEERRRDYLERIARGTATLSALVDDVLEVARIESGELRFESSSVDLTALATRAVTEVTPANATPRVRVEGEAAVPPAVGDESRLLQVMVNLLSNALKFSPDDSPVIVRVRHQGGDVRVDVVDQGPGIASPDQELLFQRFSRLPRMGAGDIKGTGLGLYICKSFIEAQRGRIWVESVPGTGSTFSFTIPAAEVEAAL